MALVKWRADPRQVRVSVRHLKDDSWFAEVVNRNHPHAGFTAVETTAKLAIDQALEMARGRMDGLDDDWVYYKHPWK